MTKALYIAEKPSVGREFAAALKENMRNHDGYLESEHAIVTWCFGHLVTMSYPEAYGEEYRRWRLETLPFIPDEFRYEVIDSAKKQFQKVAALLNREDVDTIFICTDSGREGEYIYRLVDQMAHVSGKTRRRVWIDSQTEEEIQRGIREAKDWSEYDNLSASAYLRAKEDYLMGINFSRLLTLKYGNSLASFLGKKRAVISVGRVMTCVLGMVVRREREIRAFVKTPFYRVMTDLDHSGFPIRAEWKAVQGSAYFQSPCLYKDNGFREKKDAEELIARLSQTEPQTMKVLSVERKKERKNPPLLYNLAELQNDCSKLFKISPEDTLKVVQELYERKLVTYPRTDARVLSTAIAKEIARNIRGLTAVAGVKEVAGRILSEERYQGISKTKYVNDKMITDHYAIIPTGQGLGALRGLPSLSAKVYEVIVRRFLAIFLDPAIYQKISLTAAMQTPSVTLRDGSAAVEQFQAGSKVLVSEGYLCVMQYSFTKKKDRNEASGSPSEADGTGTAGEQSPEEMAKKLAELKRGSVLPVSGYEIKEGETSPPKRYNSGSMILAMENAGQLIEDEELREQIKGCGIGTSATRSGILEKLIRNQYLQNQKKTQIIMPTLMGELIYDIVNASIRSLLNPELTASWEKGLNYVAEGSITTDEYMQKLDHFIRVRTAQVMNLRNQIQLNQSFREAARYYK